MDIAKLTVFRIHLEYVEHLEHHHFDELLSWQQNDIRRKTSDKNLFYSSERFLIVYSKL